MSAPIKVGILGLSASGTSGSSWAQLAHLDYLKSSPKFELVAVCNSSVESSKKAIGAFGLPASTKAYGNPEDLAKDADVQLVVSCTRVDKHMPTLVPSLQHGKDVFSEWPLASNLKDAEEGLKIAQSKGVRTVVGLQGRLSPLARKLKEVLDSGRIGDVLSSTFVGAAGAAGETESEAMTYLADRKIGGNMGTIAMGHSLDVVLSALGEFETFNSVASTQRPTVPLVNSANKAVGTIERTAFDNIALQGQLKTAKPIKPVLSYHLRGGNPFPSSQKGLLWNIYGTKGEIQITGSSVYLNVGSPDLELWVFENGKEKAEKVEIVDSPFFASLPFLGQNIAKLYEGYAAGQGGYPTFEDAVVRHRIIDEIEKRAVAAK